jgi:uncharacterized protein (DUF302 family)
MQYYISKSTRLSFEAAESKMRLLLADHGFGILTEIDVQATLKKKLDVDFKRYKILGACNPQFAHKALLAEDKIGLMLPCNVIIQQLSNDVVEVAAINPMATIASVGNEKLEEFASQVYEKLSLVLEKL